MQGFYMLYFKQKLKVLRQSKLLSQAELAQKICASRQTIAKWELAMQEPSLKSLKKLCKFFNIRLDELIGTFEE